MVRVSKLLGSEVTAKKRFAVIMCYYLLCHNYSDPVLSRAACLQPQLYCALPILAK